MARYAVRSDLHGRIDIAKEHERMLECGEITGIFDLGDIEAFQIGPEHPLRRAQREGERTIDAMLRNGRANPQLVEATITAVLAGMQGMSAHEKSVMHGGNYRGIAGNGRESWLALAQETAPARYDELVAGFDQFMAMRYAAAEFFTSGTAVLYLPWKTPIEHVSNAMDQIESGHPDRIIILSHDYLTEASLDIPPRSNENAEQIALALDRATSITSNVSGYFGHVGMQFGPWEKTFNYNGKDVTTYHVDERAGKPLFIEL